MTKKELVKGLACVGLPEDVTLVEMNIGNAIRMARWSSNCTFQLDILMAHMLQKRLEADTEGMVDELCPGHFVKLHKSLHAYHREAFDATVHEEVERDIIANHQRMVQYLHETAAKLNIAYEDPPDSIMAL